MAISSVSGRETDFAAGPYGTIKAAMIHYMQGLANQLAAKGIRANFVSPGNIYFEGGVWQSIEQNQPEFFACAMALNPTKRMATPDEIARTVVFVASPASSRTSGANVLVDGALSRGVQFELHRCRGRVPTVSVRLCIWFDGSLPDIVDLFARAYSVPVSIGVGEL